MSTSTSWASDRVEAIERPEASRTIVLVPGAELRPMAGAHNGAHGLFTGLLTLAPGAIDPIPRAADGRGYGPARGRRGRQRRGSALPPRAARRRRRNAGPAATGRESLRRPARRVPRRPGPGRAEQNWINGRFAPTEQPPDSAGRDGSERVVRRSGAPVTELAPHAMFQDLYNAELGTRGICGGHGLFAPARDSPATATSSTSPSPSSRGPPPASSRAGATSWPGSPPPWSPGAAATTSSTSPSSPWP